MTINFIRFNKMIIYRHFSIFRLNVRSNTFLQLLCICFLICWIYAEKSMYRFRSPLPFSNGSNFSSPFRSRSLNRILYGICVDHFISFKTSVFNVFCHSTHGFVFFIEFLSFIWSVCIFLLLFDLLMAFLKLVLMFSCSEN